MSAPGLRLVLGGLQDEAFGRFLAQHCKRRNWALESAPSGAEVAARLAEPAARLVVLDARLEDATLCCERVKTEPHTWLVPVLVVFSGERQVEREREFFVCGDHHLFEPFEMVDFFRLVEREGNAAAGAAAPGPVEIRLQVPSLKRELDRAQELLSKLMARAGLPEARCWEMDTAVREGLLNAFQHGNRGQPEKMIRVCFRADERQLTVTVQDEGPGFDYQRFLAQGREEDAITLVRRRHQEGRVGGLGILLMSKSVDGVQYSPNGSAVTFVKYR